MRPEESEFIQLVRTALASGDMNSWRRTIEREIDTFEVSIARRAKLAELGEKALQMLRWYDEDASRLEDMENVVLAIKDAARSLGLLDEAKPDLRQCSSCREWVAEELSLHRGLCHSCVAACEHPSEGLK